MRLLAARMVGARLELMAGVGHMVPLEAPEALAAAVQEFVGEAGRAG